MKFPLSWMRDWIEVPDQVDQIGDLLIKVGVGLEAVENPAEHLGDVVVARVLKREPHPNADKLSLCQVLAGSETLQIVCGAKNFKEGDLVPLAKEGAVLPGNFKIKRSKIRGVESFGMLCSSEELGLGQGEDGLLLLKEGFKEGTPLAQALGLDDPVFDVETTANRPDHLSVRGLSREIAALTGKPMKAQEIQISESGTPLDSTIKVSSSDSQACPLYLARIIRGVKVGPSPDWMRRRLEGAGIRSINNVVDITNYVLIEYGQPMHAFDLNSLEGGLIEVRLARTGETLKTLDGQDRNLEDTDLVIADSKKAVALAGVMGGAATEVRADTQDILLEAAVFQPLLVRRTSRRLGLRSESSLRFERGVDSSATLEALNRASSLLVQLAGGKVAPQVARAGAEASAHPEIIASANRINALLGSSHTAEHMASLLQRRGFKTRVNGDALAATSPLWRRDVAQEADLAEEVAHLAGLDGVPSTHLPEVRTPDPDATEWSNHWVLRSLLQDNGLREAVTLSFLDPVLAGQWGIENSVKIDNPLNAEISLLRPSLLPNLVACALESLKHQAEGAALYELGRAFASTKEENYTAVVLCGDRGEGNWAAKPGAYDFYDLRGILEHLAQDLGYTLKVQASTDKIPAWLHPGKSARLNLGPMMGWMGALHPALMKRLDARKEIYVAEWINGSKASLGRIRKYQRFSSLPHVERDLSCLVDVGFEAGSLLEAIHREGFAEGQVRLKDVYQGSPLPEKKKSLTVSLRYLAEENTLTDDEVNLRHAALVAKLKASMPLEIRD